MTDLDDLKARYVEALDAQYNEQFYQEFLETHTKLLPREFVQNHGVHFELVLRKLSFGNDYVSDFFFLSKSSDDWNCVFIEIEKPSSKYFRGNTNNFHSDFHKGLDQIDSWRAWLSQPANAQMFLENTIAPLRVPLAMRRNPSFMKFVLVTGRRAEYETNQIRRNLVQAKEQHDFKIMSFDSLAEALHTKHECYIGVRKNECIDILGDRLISSNIFGWIEPTLFSVSKELHKQIQDAPAGSEYRFDENGKMMPAVKYVIPRLQVR